MACGNRWPKMSILLQKSSDFAFLGPCFAYVARSVCWITLAATDLTLTLHGSMFHNRSKLLSCICKSDLDLALFLQSAKTIAFDKCESEDYSGFGSEQK